MLCVSVLPSAAFGQESGQSDRQRLRPLADFWGAIKDFGYDTWRVASSPARIDARSGTELAGALAIGALLFVQDEPISERIVEEPGGGIGKAYRDLGEWLEPVGLQSNTNWILATTAAAGYLTRQHWLQLPAKQLLYAQWIGGLGRQLSGRLVGRRRPNETDNAYTFDEGTSFPSGHAAVAMEVAYILSHHIDWMPASVALYGMASAVVYERAFSNAHWASDAWLGAAWGLAVARIVVAAEESERVSVRPSLDPATGRGGIAVSLAMP